MAPLQKPESKWKASQHAEPDVSGRLCGMCVGTVQVVLQGRTAVRFV